MAFTDVTPQQTVTTNDKFIPELWSDEIIAVYEQTLVLAPKVRKLSMKGKKGDTIHVPKPGRGEASAKVAEEAVTLVADTASELVITVDQHFQYSRMIEDITDVQSLSSSRRFYTEDAGYALAKNVDTALFGLGTGIGDGTVADADTPANWVHSNTIRINAGGTASEAWAEDDMTAAMTFDDIVFRAALQKLDDADVPMSARCLVICPSAVNDIRGIDRYNSVDFVNNKGVANGQIGNIYGVPVYVSTNVPVIETAVENGGGSVVSRGNLLMHKDAYVLAEQLGVRSQTQYLQEHLSTLFTSDRIYGLDVYRPENAVTIATAE